jgi:hypothetical protein
MRRFDQIAPPLPAVAELPVSVLAVAELPINTPLALSLA